MEILSKIGGAVMAVYSLLVAYRALFLIVGFFTKARVFPEAKKLHTYGIVIAARNEEAVLGKLLESIRLQDYDPRLLTVYVVADNCTDGTAAVARSFGARVYERFDSARARKGWALQYLFEQIDRDYGIGSVDAYLFFDADNLLAPDFVSQINKAFDASGDMAVGYRNTKNFDDSFISAAYGLHFYEATMCLHRPRSFFGQSTHIAGTGCAVASRLLRDGWRWTYLTEDTQLTLDLVSRGVKIEFCEAAEFFDEQPHSAGVMVRQRLRWAKGRLSCFFALFPRLLRGIFTCRERKFSCYDMFFYILPKALLSALASVAYALTGFILGLAAGGAAAPGLSGLWAAAPGILGALGLSWLRLTATGALVALRERRHIRCGRGRLALYVLLWPFFDLTGLPISIASLFMRVRWKPIRHDQPIAITQLTKKAAEAGQK